MCVSSYAFGKVLKYRVFGKYLALASYISASVIELVNLKFDSVWLSFKLM